MRYQAINEKKIVRASRIIGQNSLDNGAYFIEMKSSNKRSMLGYILFYEDVRSNMPITVLCYGN